MIHKEIDGNVVTRKYTPVSHVNEKGVVAFVIKIYRKCAEFPNGGKMSQALETLNVGDKVKMEGPKGLLNYHGDGNFLIKNNPVKKTKIGLVAGGTGITPIYQLV
jgi:ferredoxin-NADP reductase